MLTDSIIQKAKPKAKQYRLSDGNGLSLLVYPTGGKSWRYRYSFEGKENMISLGIYPDISLEEARKKLAEARTTKALGRDPSKRKVELKQEAINKRNNTFELIAREWYEKEKSGWDPKYAKRVLRRLEMNLFPSLGSYPIKDIKPLQFLDVIRKVEERGSLDVAKRCCQDGSQIFEYAIITERAEYDIVSTIKRALQAPPPVQHRKYIESHELNEFFQKLAQYDGELLTKLATRFLILTFVRTKELRGAMWEEIHWGKKQWVIPASRMKMRDMHIVPLAPQTLELLTQVQKISGHTPFLFSHVNNPRKIMSENTILYALYRMGYHSRATGHGFRATAATSLKEMGFPSEWIEIQLAHVERNQTKKAYDHATLLPEREYMMQHWANFLDAVSQEDSTVTTNDFRVRTYKHAPLCA